jgi:hypothetical protein
MYILEARFWRESDDAISQETGGGSERAAAAGEMSF